MRKVHFLPFLLLLLALFSTRSEVKASHNMGVDLTYECINNCTIRVHLRGYRDCSGINLSQNQTITFTPTSGSGCIPPNPVSPLSTAVITEVTPVCPGWPTRCNTPGAAINGVEEWYWFRDYDICSSGNCIWTLSWNDCCRNSAITSTVSGGMYIGATTLNTGLTNCNSSPQFANPPVPYICNSQTFLFNQGAFDPDGDSLVYFLGPCSTSASVQATYGNGYTPQQPLGSNWTVLMDSATGDISITPTPGSLEVGVLCIYVQEYRNGQLINTIVRDMQVTVLNCSNNNPFIAVDSNSVSGGSQLGSQFVYNTCIGSPLTFDIYGYDADSTGPTPDTICMWWSDNIPGASFYRCSNPNDSDTVCSPPNPLCATFSWTPTQAGVYTFLVQIQDNGCPILGIGQNTFTIYVGGMSVAATDTATGCGDVDFCSVISGNGPFTYTWSGPGGLSSNPSVNDSCLSHTYPGPGNYPYTLQVADSLGCVNTISQAVNIPNTVTANAGADIAICSGFVGNIGAASVPDEVYLWTPSTGLSNANVSNPTVTLTNNTLATQTFMYIVEATDTVTTCVDYDTVMVTVYPIPQAQFSMPANVCQFDAVNVTYTGPNGPGATYNWTFGPGSVPSTATGAGPHQVSWNTFGMKAVSLFLVENGCTSATYIDSIEVFQQPIANIAPVTGQCIQGNSFNFVNASTYGPGAQFVWTFFPNSNTPASVAENPSGISFTTAGTKYATLQITENGCVSNIDTVSFQVFPQPDPAFITVGSPQCQSSNSYCFQSTGANGVSATYAWSFQDANPSTSTASNPCNINFTDCGMKGVTLTVTENGCVSTYTDSVQILCNPEVDAGPDVAFCEGEGGAGLTGSVTGGTPQYYWTWWCDSTSTWCGLDSVHDNDPNANPTASTMYYTQIVDFNGCVSNVDSAFVTVMPKPQVNAGPDVTICADPAPCQIIQASVSGAPGPFTYQWFPSAGLNADTILNPCARPDTTTIYTLVATSVANGCNSATTTVDTNSTVTVIVNPLPVGIAHSSDTADVCLGDSVELQGYGFNAGPGYAYQWSPSTGLSANNVPNPNASPAQATEYILTVWSNGCPSYGDTVLVDVHTNPTADAGPDVEICLGEDGQLDGEAWGDPTASGYTYQWWPNSGFVTNPSDENPLVSPGVNTVYYLTATSVPWGCVSPVDSTTLIVKPTPEAEAGPNLILCEGGEVQLQGNYTMSTPANPSQIYFSWTPTDSLSDPTILTPMANPVVSTTYSLTVSYNTCSDTDDMLVTVLPSLDIGADQDTSVVCGGDSVQLYSWGGLGGADYTWIPALGLDDPNTPNPMAAPSTSTTYQVIVSEGSCVDTAEVTLEVLPTPQSAYVNSQAMGCVPLEVSFLETTADAMAWTWDFGDGSPVSNMPNPSHVFDAPGTYTVTLSSRGLGNCTSEAATTTITVMDTAYANFSSNPGHPATLPMPNAEVQFTEESTNGVNWSWDFGDGITSDASNPSHMWTNPGEYWVKLMVTNEIGCVTEVMHGPYIVRIPDLFIPNVFTPNGDGFNDEFIVNYDGDQPFNLTITDRWGVPHFTSNNKTTGWDGNSSSPVLEGNSLPEGVYYYEIRIGDRRYVGNVTMLR